MCVISPFTFNRCGTNSKIKVSRRRPIARIIHYFLAFGRLLLFVGWGIWFFLFVCFVLGMAKRNDFHPFNEIFFYPAVVMGLVYSGIIAASGTLGEIKWWPSRDSLSHLIPLSIRDASMTKCRWTHCFITLERSDNGPRSSSHPTTSDHSASSGLSRAIRILSVELRSGQLPFVQLWSLLLPT